MVIVRKRLIFGMTILLVIPSLSHGIDADYILYKETRVPIPLTYTVHRVITYLGEGVEYLSEPEDIFIDEKEILYVADTGNNRIVKLTKEGRMLAVFNGPEESPLSGPRGVYVDEDGDLYIADTENSRIVHLSPDGSFVEEFVKPESSLLIGFDFQPVKLYVSTINSIFVLNRTHYLGIMEIDADGQFVGYSGSTQVGFSILQLFLRLFASEQQKAQIARRVAPPYSNLVMDKNDLIYATTITVDSEQIARLNAVGINTYKKGFFGESIPDFFTGDPLIPEFVDLAVDKNGIISGLEKRSGKIYQYDQEGNLLTVFGEKGNRLGSFKTPTSIAVDGNGLLYVLDSGKSSIQVLKPTSFINLIHDAVNLYQDGRYIEAMEMWNEIQEIDANYKLAHIGKGKSYSRQGEFKIAMVEHRKGGDPEGYSTAFKNYRFETAKRFFGVVFFSVIVAAIGLIFLVFKTRKLANAELRKIVSHSSGVRRTGPFAMVPMVLFHPGEAFLAIRSWRERANYLPALVLFVLIIAVRIGEIFAVHFPLAVVDPRDANLIAEITRMLLPIITWVLASYAITAIMDGESLFREALTAAGYAMLPYIIFTVPVALSTHLMSSAEAGLYTSLKIATWIWVLLLFIMSVYRMNSFTLRKTVGVCLLCIVGIASIWLLLLILFTLTDQLFGFFGEVKEEVRALIYGFSW